MAIGVLWPPLWQLKQPRSNGSAAAGWPSQKETPAPDHILLLLFSKSQISAITHWLACQESWHQWLILKFLDLKLLHHSGSWRWCFLLLLLFFCLFLLFNEIDPLPLLLIFFFSRLNPKFTHSLESQEESTVWERVKRPGNCCDWEGRLGSPCSAFLSMWPKASGILVLQKQAKRVVIWVCCYSQKNTYEAFTKPRSRDLPFLLSHVTIPTTHNALSFP